MHSPARTSANDNTLLRASSGGASANVASSPACLICLATSRLLTLGFASSPWLTATQRTEISGFPVTRRASPMARRSHTALALK